jgi:hypothetical protein
VNWRRDSKRYAYSKPVICQTSESEQIVEVLACAEDSNNLEDGLVVVREDTIEEEGTLVDGEGAHAWREVISRRAHQRVQQKELCDVYEPRFESFSGLPRSILEEVSDMSVEIVSSDVQNPKAHRAFSSLRAAVRHLGEELFEVVG